MGGGHGWYLSHLTSRSAVVANNHSIVHGQKVKKMKLIAYLILLQSSNAFLNAPSSLYCKKKINSDAAQSRKINTRVYTRKPVMGKTTKFDHSSSPVISSKTKNIRQNRGTFDPLNLSSSDRRDKSLLRSSSASSNIAYDMLETNEKDKQPLGPWAARGILLLVAVLWGTNFGSVKYLETLCLHPPCHHFPSESALARFGVAALVGLPFLVGKQKDIILAGFECGALISAGYITQAMALESIPSARCAFICSLTVVVVPFMSALLDGKPVKSMHLVAGILALGGVGILEGLVDVKQLMMASATSSGHVVLHAAHGGSSHIIHAATAAKSFFGLSKGDLVALGQPFGFGLAFMRIEHYVEKYKDTENRIMTMSAAQCLAVGFVSLIWAMHDYQWHIPDLAYMIEPHRLIAIAWTGIVTTVIAIYLEGFALQTASATEAAITFASEPVWASLFGAWLLHERMNTNSYVGGTIILLACLLGSLADINSSESSSNANE